MIPSASIVVDPDQQYLLSSNGWFATSEITSNLAPSGVSTGLNALSTDSTAGVVSGIVGTAAQIAIGAAASATDIPSQVASELCNLEIATAVNDMYPEFGSSLKEQLEKNTANLAVATARVAVATARAAADKDDKSLKAALIAAIDDQASAQDALAQNQGKLSRGLKLTTDVQVVTWPRFASEFRRDNPYAIDNSVLLKWTKATADSQQARNDFNVYLALYNFDRMGESWRLPSTTETADVSIGIPVRLARFARLLMCVSSRCPEILPATTYLTDKQNLCRFRRAAGWANVRTTGNRW